MITEIDPKEISFVVQGKYFDATAEYLTSLRALFPESEIILSTWECDLPSVVDRVVDFVVFSNDPGCSKHDFCWDLVNNQNRMVVTMLAGIHKSSRKYVCKLRSDFYLEGASFLKYWDAYPERDLDWAIFTHRVIICSAYTRYRSSETRKPTPFHPSDLFLFGLKEDIRSLFEARGMITPEEEGNWKYKYPDRIPYQNAQWRYPPEQSMFFALVKKHFPLIEFDDWSDYNETNVQESEEIMLNNFIVLDYDHIQLASPKHDNGLKSSKNQDFGIITHDLFNDFYKEKFNLNIDIEEQIIGDETGQSLRKDLLCMQQLKHEFHQIQRPFGAVRKWFKAFFRLFFLACRFSKQWVKAIARKH